ncbi:beta-ketoacyl synthase N-terminal-like domain-containing protein [Kibdelosporangium banguiense]|uniref:beta-ketoacyl synthase N-terminal-like domain-containing protein n=1 Tax=Kibdelosporangium banguiense TaxID=1365924 RepID=UPI001FD94A43|nr:beta-ketoacyl synthase N-terminal-like domain-containing protein [Kibdelosporangium banguiense]
MRARCCQFSADAAEFDGDFFGIAPREAAAMDPQVGLLCWWMVVSGGMSRGRRSG